MDSQSFRAFADCLREPAVLVSTSGEVIALNAAAGTLLGVESAIGHVTFRLADFLHGGGAALDDFIRACARTRQPIFAALALRMPSGQVQPYRAEGLLHDQSADGAATVFLRLTPRDVANAPLQALDERLRAFARARGGAPRLLNVNDVVSNTTALLRPLVGERVELLTHLASTPARVYVDSSLLERILVNLAVHARDTMADGGRLVIETSRSGGLATVTVRSSGGTLTREEEDRIFEPNPPLSRGGGPAISLASSRALLHEAGGNIELAPAAAGIAFVVSLPLAQGDDESATAVAPESITVLVVDDDDMARDLIADSLQAAGFSVLSASDGAAALEIAREQPAIDLLVTDVVMPGLTGPRVADAVRNLFPKVRVLYVSGYTDRTDLPTDAPGTRSAFLAKPFTRGTLLGTVNALIE